MWTLLSRLRRRYAIVTFRLVDLLLCKRTGHNLVLNLHVSWISQGVEVFHPLITWVQTLIRIRRQYIDVFHSQDHWDARHLWKNE